MNPLADARYDGIIWCAMYFLISFVGFWLPILALNLVDAHYHVEPSSGGSFILVFTGPFALIAGVASVFRCRKLVASRKQGGPLAPSHSMIALGLIFTMGALSPFFTFCIVLIAVVFGG